MTKWLSTRELVDLVEDHFPLSMQDVREYCEDGTIPQRFVKRKKAKDRRHWRIASSGLHWILENVLSLEPEEIAEVAEKAPIIRKQSA